MEFDREHMRVCGRGASGIYLVLSHLAPSGMLLAPANICYAALYPALYAGWTVGFCDVDPVTGNVTLPLFRDALDRLRPDAAIVPHMYGQPVADMAAIARLCGERGVTLVEDCASAMGATADYPLGDMGDYTVYSTGYAKTVELGFGGIVASRRHDLGWFDGAQEALPPWTPQVERTEHLFSRLYRVLRNEGDGLLEHAVYAALPEGARDLFLYRLDEGRAARVSGAFDELPAVVAHRRSVLRECLAALGDAGCPVLPADGCDPLATEDGFAPGLYGYPFSEGAVPWRLCLFTPFSRHRGIIEECLKEALPISDWYPRVTPLFAERGDYPGAFSMERSIVNFALTDSCPVFVCPRLARIALM